MQLDTFYQKAVNLLKLLIATESFSRQEEKTADLIEAFFQENGIACHREKNNVWAYNQFYQINLPTILLNSHHDTVRPNPDWTRNPFEAEIEEGKLFGLGSNDAGGCLVALLVTFLHFYSQENLSYNIVMAATAEEEVSGKEGLELVYLKLGPIEFAIVGEPTQMHLAIAEKGLLVLDCVTKGTSGHAAREEGINAIYKAIPDIQWFQTFRFPKESEYLGPVKMSVTIIKAGTQHNVIPDQCTFTVDVRVTDTYSHAEILEIIRAHVSCEVTPRSLRLKPSRISKDAPIVQAGISLGRHLYGSPTTSDQALLSIPSLKLGPGDSARSHTADEFIFLNEIKEGIQIYISILSKVLFH